MAPAVEIRRSSQSVFGRRHGCSYWEEGFDLEYDEVAHLLRQQKIIESGLVEATRHLNSSSDGAEQLTNALADIRALITRLYDMIPAIERPATAVSAAKAQQVFTTPELLEEILTHLPTRQKLRVMAGQRCWRETLLGSIRLKRLLGLVPPEKDSKLYYSAFFDRFQRASRYECSNDFPGWSFSDDLEWASENAISLVIHSWAKRPTKLGSRVQTMLVINRPPLTRLDVEMICCPCPTRKDRGGDSVDRGLGSISSDTPLGFTVGELSGKVDELKKRHPQCYEADRCSQRVYLRASVTLDDDDPVLVEKRKQIQALAELDAARDASLLSEVSEGSEYE